MKNIYKYASGKTAKNLKEFYNHDDNVLTAIIIGVNSSKHRAVECTVREFDPNSRLYYEFLPQEDDKIVYNVFYSSYGKITCRKFKRYLTMSFSLHTNHKLTCTHNELKNYKLRIFKGAIEFMEKHYDEFSTDEGCIIYRKLRKEYEKLTKRIVR